MALVTGLQRVGRLASSPVILAAIFFAAAGRLDWAWAWAYLGISLANILVVSLISMRAITATTTKPEESTVGEGWDTRSTVYQVAMYIALPLVAGLDVRFGWAGDLRAVWHVASAAVLAAGAGIAAWAIATNVYSWSPVAVQERQTVCSTGPYRFVRHPAYLGSILQALGVSILLGSFWSLSPSCAAAVCMIFATSSEDRVLLAKLPGYKDYAGRVPFRLVPGVW